MKFSVVTTGEIKAKNLISGFDSRRILDSIISCTSEKALLIKYSITDAQLNSLQSLYQQKVTGLDKKKSYPRYYPFYLIIKEKYPSISWDIHSNHDGKSIVNFKLPLINKLQPALINLLLDRVTVQEVSSFQYNYPMLSKQTLKNQKVLEEFFRVTEAIKLSQQQMTLFLNWLHKAVSGELSHIFIHTCPDYYAEPTSDPTKPYKHTFESLGNGIGQIAQRSLKLLPHLKLMLDSLNISPDIIIAIADYEALSTKTLDRVALTENEFLQKVRTSLDKYLLANKSVALTGFMFTELSGGADNWLSVIDEIREQFANKNFGLSGIAESYFLKVAKSRNALYKRWYGSDSTIKDITNLARSQAIEYAAVGYFINKKFENCLVLGTDSDLFGPLYSYYKVTPTIYFERYYC